jgi:proteic killer suppression protein
VEILTPIIDLYTFLVYTIIMTLKSNKKIVVELSKETVKLIKRNQIPVNILEAAFVWVDKVESLGLERVRQEGGKGLHDEPVKGASDGKRSIRLNKAWRLYYTINEKGEVIVVTVERIDRHKY